MNFVNNYAVVTGGPGTVRRSLVKRRVREVVFGPVRRATFGVSRGWRGGVLWARLASRRVLPSLALRAIGGPSRQVLRPAELDSRELRQFLQSEALTSDRPVLNLAHGTDLSIRGDMIVLEQHNGNSVAVSETGSIVVVQAVVDEDLARMGIPAVIQEDVVEYLERAVRFVGTVLDHADRQQRLSHVVPLAALLDVGSRVWRTREEHERHPTSATMNLHGRDFFGRVPLEATLAPATRRRMAFMHESRQIAEDLAVRLRRAAGLDR